MATRRRKQTSVMNTKSKSQSKDATTRKTRSSLSVELQTPSADKQTNRSVKTEEEEYVDVTNMSDPGEQGSITSKQSNSPGTSMSLDVLAQVATATLENNQSSPEQGTAKKLSKRSVQSLDVLNLEQIRMLSDKALVHMFSEMSANEMTRNYTYTCFLIPEKCSATFTSFGNESRARMRLRAHLLEHIGELLQEANAPERVEPFKFSAEPVSARKRRLAALKKYKKRYSSPAKSGHTSLSPTTCTNQEDQNSNYTIIKPADKTKDSTSCRSLLTTFSDSLMDAGSDKIANNEKLLKTDSASEQIVEYSEAVPCFSNRSPQNGVNVKAESRADLENFSVEEFYIENSNEFDATQQIAETHMDLPGSEVEVVSSAPRTPEENQQYILEQLNRQQPHHDHCYTSYLGKKRGIETMHFDIDTSEDESDEMDDQNKQAGPEQQPMPVMLISADVNDVLSFQQSAPGAVQIDGQTASAFRMSEMEGVNKTQGVRKTKSKDSAGLYPPMPKSDLAQKGRVVVLEEALSSSEEEELVQNAKQKRVVVEGSAEWERKMALRCIRELKLKKKDDRSPLVCKICMNKAFTATATLMYHYRSHAGIKPFICLICNTTFTRQHSLNYHMLIHNNQSRFTCKDCNRKFRHPSHFKEHLRRHTGETPFHCTDCPLKFKTRNTYKRHLKTRHGKLLTATGIHIMPDEEFEKVRTKFYRHSFPEELGDSEEEEVQVVHHQAVQIEHRPASPLPVLAPPPNPLIQF